MNRLKNRAFLLFALLAFSPAPLLAQEKAPAPKARPPAEEHVVKVYRVIDLVLPAPNYPYDGTYLPNAGDGTSPRTLTASGVGGGMMGGMGGGMGGMGGGMFQVADRLAQKPGMGGVGGGGGGPKTRSPDLPAGAVALDMDQLIEAITGTVEPSTWDEVGGPGSIVPIGGALAVRQTPAIQAKVQEFLDALAREGGSQRMITVRARWLLLSRRQLAELVGSSEPKQPGPTPHAVNPKALAALAPQTERYAGQITCFNGQTVHIVSGRLETIVGGAIPVVGGQIAYQPLMLAPHIGVLLQIKPSALPNGEAALVDLQSTITRWGKAPKPARIGTSPAGESVIEVDRINVAAQQFATSLRVPLDQPVLVAGMTVADDEHPVLEAPAEKAEAVGPPGLYLVIELESSGA
jgi:hypothetical protein